MIPSADAQLQFLSKLQRLFAEGEFTATYKFALLIAIADLAVELGHDDDRPLALAHRALAAKFIELYWQQTAPYAAQHAEPRVLIQNKGTQAAVVNAIVAFRSQCPAATVASARTLPGFRDLVGEVTKTVARQPVNYLQNFGGMTDPFLYERTRGGITLHPGVTYCLRRFQSLIQHLARTHWLAHIKENRQNLVALGEASDLESFLFETPRQALTIIGDGLRRLCGPRCFYCGTTVSEHDVDHYVPFALYPRDLAHNFVLAHPQCNRSKSDTLAARVHLERWVDHIARHDAALREIGVSAGRIGDLAVSRSVAAWAYRNAVAAEAKGWLEARRYQAIDADCLTVLGG